MSNNDIQNYLVEPDFAKWLKKIGFDGECAYVFNVVALQAARTTFSVSNKRFKKKDYLCAAPTFAQAFDFVEDKYNIWPVNVNKNVSGYGFHLGKEYYSYKTKREANIAACNAIREYVDKLENV